MNIVDEFKVSPKNAKECIEIDMGIMEDRVQKRKKRVYATVHQGKKGRSISRRRDPEWMHVVGVDSVGRGLQIEGVKANLIQEWNKSNPEVMVRQGDIRGECHRIS